MPLPRDFTGKISATMAVDTETLALEIPPINRLSIKIANVSDFDHRK